jgi:hypothetical protein
MWEEADLSGGWADTAGMSARELLYVALMNGGPHSPARSERASALIDAFAHELAEEIRAESDPGSPIFVITAEEAADLIDPQVTEYPWAGPEVSNA